MDFTERHPESTLLRFSKKTDRYEWIKGGMRAGNFWKSQITRWEAHVGVFSTFKPAKKKIYVYVWKKSVLMKKLFNIVLNFKTLK